MVKWGKGGKERPRLEYFPLIMQDMGCETYREANVLPFDWAEWRRVVASNQSWDCILGEYDVIHKNKSRYSLSFDFILILCRVSIWGHTYHRYHHAVEGLIFNSGPDSFFSSVKFIPCTSLIFFLNTIECKKGRTSKMPFHYLRER